LGGLSLLCLFFFVVDAFRCFLSSIPSSVVVVLSSPALASQTGTVPFISACWAFLRPFPLSTCLCDDRNRTPPFFFFLRQKVGSTFLGRRSLFRALLFRSRPRFSSFLPFFVNSPFPQPLFFFSSRRARSLSQPHYCGHAANPGFPSHPGKNTPLFFFFFYRRTFSSLYFSKVKHWNPFSPSPPPDKGQSFISFPSSRCASSNYPGGLSVFLSHPPPWPFPFVLFLFQPWPDQIPSPTGGPPSGPPSPFPFSCRDMLRLPFRGQGVFRFFWSPAAKGPCFLLVIA